MNTDLIDTLEKTTVTGFFNGYKCRFIMNKGARFVCVVDLHAHGLDIDRKAYTIQRTTILDTHIEKCELCLIDHIQHPSEKMSEDNDTEDIYTALHHANWIEWIWTENIKNDSRKLSPGCKETMSEYEMRRWETAYRRPYHRSRYNGFNRRLELQNKKIKKMTDDERDHYENFQSNMNRIFKDYKESPHKEQTLPKTTNMSVYDYEYYRLLNPDMSKFDCETRMTLSREIQFIHDSYGILQDRTKQGEGVADIKSGALYGFYADWCAKKEHDKQFARAAFCRKIAKEEYATKYKDGKGRGFKFDMRKLKKSMDSIEQAET